MLPIIQLVSRDYSQRGKKGVLGMASHGKAITGSAKPACDGTL